MFIDSDEAEAGAQRIADTEFGEGVGDDGGSCGNVIGNVGEIMFLPATER